jgi:hypothetical protein
MIIIDTLWIVGVVLVIAAGVIVNHAKDPVTANTGITLVGIPGVLAITVAVVIYFAAKLIS